MADPRPDSLRVAVLGSDPDLRQWAAMLSGTEIEATTAADLTSLLASGPGFVVAFLTPEAGPRVAAEVAALSDPPPVALVLASPGRPDPLRRLLNVLVQARHDWESSFDALHDPVAILAPDGSVRRANVGLAAGLGLPITTLAGHPYTELLGAVPPGMDDPIARTLADGTARTQEAQYERLPGIRQVTTSVVGLEGPRSVIAILKDVTEMKEQQVRAMQAFRLADVGQLAGGVAHEISTPLASIALRAESLLKKAEHPALQSLEAFGPFPRYLKTIYDDVFRCKAIIGALLDFSRSRRAEIQGTDLNAVARGAAQLFSHAAAVKQVELQVELDEALPIIQGDETQLRQAVMALLRNAIDASGPGGHVVVRTARQGEASVSMTVEDEGPGIPAEHIDKIFTPFFTTKPVGQGAGLGLAVCHGVATAHGGEITAVNRVPQGARFSMVLPMKAGRG